MAVDMRLTTVRKHVPLSISLFGQCNKKNLVIPGDIITKDNSFMRGHGTYLCEETATASVAGEVERVDKLIYVRPHKTRFSGVTGDVVVGRIIEVQQKRWRVETNSNLDSVLQLSSVNLRGGELRRRSAEDEMKMRDYLKEGDLISAEVQSVYSDGVLSLHTRSLKYGKKQCLLSQSMVGCFWCDITPRLGQGVLMKFSPSLIKNQKTHFHNLPCGASVILGKNGFVWLYPTAEQMDEKAGGFFTNLEPVSVSDRAAISRLRNCLVALDAYKVLLYDTSILYCYEFSLHHPIKDILKPEVMEEIVMLTQEKLAEHEG